MTRLLLMVCFTLINSVAWSANILTADQQKSLGIRTSPPIVDDVAISAQVLGQVQLSPQALLTVSRPYGLQIQKISVHLGDQVALGQPLMVAYVPELQTLEHQYHNALSSAKLAEQKLTRESQLFKEGVISLKQYESTKTEFQQIQENLTGIFIQLQRMGLSSHEMSLLKDPMNHHLEGKITLLAEQAGKVHTIAVAVGQSLEANAHLMTILTNNALTIDIPLSHRQLNGLNVGDQLSLDDGTPINITNVQSKLSDAQKIMVTGQFQHRQLKAGQWVSVQLPKTQQAITWRLPRQSITYVDNQPHLIALNQGQLQFLPVTLVRATRDGWVLSCKELTEKSQVVVSGTAAAKGILTGETE